MAVAVDNASQSSTTSATSLTIQHTASGSNRLAIVGAYTYRGDQAGAVPTATYDSTSMSSVTTTLFGSGDVYERISMLYLAPPSTTTNADVVISASPTQDEIVGGVVTFTGVDQTSPLDTPKAEVDDFSTSSTMDITSETDDMVVDAVAFYNASSDTVTVGASQTEQVDLTGGTTTDDLHMSTEPGSTTTTMSWDYGSVEFYVGQIGVNINAWTGIQTSGTLNGGGSISAAVTKYEDQVARPSSTGSAGTWDTGPTTGQSLHGYTSDQSDATYIEDTAS